jgi:hypothetical protein
MPEPFPLAWPEGFPRQTSREAGQFRTSLAQALSNVKASLEAFGRDSRKPVAGIVLSTNVSLGQDKPDDPGVAVWFTWDGHAICIPVDRYKTPAANLQAIHHVLEARRVELRHGTLALVRATMSGFLALPAPVRPWWIVLDLYPEASRADVDRAFRRLAAERHPDRPGGSEAAMAELNAARDVALRRGGRDG